ncbi:MAG: peptide synthetase, partial [Rhodococcus sp.]|nr:peptide synthetase [Rhodococcus sp. (in: high G+C Gram-positive bacteria)]
MNVVAPTQFRRTLSPTERLYLSTRDVAPPFAIGLVVEGRGDIDGAQLRHAVDVASRACPGSRLILSGDDWIDSGTAPNVEEFPGRIDWDALDTDPVLHRRIGPGPQATSEVVVLRDRESDTTTLIFRAFHGVMDGGGIGLWAADVLRVLRGDEPIGAPDPVADVELVARLSAKGIGTQGKPTRLLPN